MMSMKSFIFVILALIAPAPPSPAVSQPKDAEAHVGIAVTSSRDTLAAGAGAEIRIAFSPKKGYHVNAVPPMALKLDTAAPARLVDTIIIPSDTATGYLKSSLPVRQAFTLAKSAAAGRAVVRGVLTYYYCSDAEGWCRKENLPFTLPVTVK
jgi:hypothetical protein